MPCLAPDGSLSPTGTIMLRALQRVRTPEALSGATDIPLYLVRVTLRDLIEAKLADEADGIYTPTAFGLEKLKEAGTAAAIPKP